MKSFDLSGRVVLLTGAAGYLGKAMAHAIVEAGADLVATGRGRTSLDACRAALPQEWQARYHIVEADITQRAQQQGVADFLMRNFGRLDGLVHNAYAGKVGAIDAIDADDFLRACHYNMIAPFELSRLLAPLLGAGAATRAGSASIVHIASMYGSVSPDPAVYGDSGNNNPVHYGVTKGGMLQMSRYLACHLANQHIRVNAISPGPFPNLDVEHGIPEFVEVLSRKVPMGRVGRPHEVAWPVVFLLSDAASFVNGANLAVDGGWTAW